MKQKATELLELARFALRAVADEIHDRAVCPRLILRDAKQLLAQPFVRDLDDARSMAAEVLRERADSVRSYAFVFSEWAPEEGEDRARLVVEVGFLGGPVHRFFRSYRRPGKGREAQFVGEVRYDGEIER